MGAPDAEAATVLATILARYGSGDSAAFDELLAYKYGVPDRFLNRPTNLAA